MGVLDTISQTAVRAMQDALSEVLPVLLETPSPAGGERVLAETLVEWGRERHPQLHWGVDPLDGDRANVLVHNGCPRPLGFYAHLDTSLSGDPVLDESMTGLTARPAPPEFGESVKGLGLAVSKGPAACALAALIGHATSDDGAAPVAVLLTSGGTHRAPAGELPSGLPAGLDQGLGYGVEAALRNGFAPAAVVNVKGGAAGVLYEEPGCLLVRLDIRERMVPVPARHDEVGGAYATAVCATAVESWRQEYMKQADPERQVAPDCGLGALRSGLPYKPDILPAVGSVYVYVVLVPNAVPADVVDDLLRHVRRESADRITKGQISVSATIYGHQPGGATDPQHPVVRRAQQLWDAEFGGGDHRITGYRGSTDGVIFRRSGIPTVRFGPTAVATQEDPRVEEIAFSELAAFAGMYFSMMQESLALT